MRYKNYQSDFEFYQELRNGQSISAVPFELIYYIPGKEHRLVASFDGEKYTNCYPNGNGVNVVVDYSSVQLGIGKMRCTARYYLDNEHFKDGIYEPVSDFEVGIELHRGESDDMGDMAAYPLPSYTKGEKGADGKDGRDGKDGKDGLPLRYEDMTEEEKEDLASHVKVDLSGYATTTDVADAIAEAITNTLNTEV